MIRKLLVKSQYSYLLVSLISFILIAPAFYLVTKKLYIEGADETLTNRKKNFINHKLPYLKEKDINNWNRFNTELKIYKTQIPINEVIFTKNIYNYFEGEYEPNRILKANIQINHKPYLIVTKVNMLESEDLIENIILLFSALTAILLIGIYIVQKRINIRIWNPFYDTLDVINKYEINKTLSISLPETSIVEFNNLNRSITKLIEKNREIYQNQSEFLENAAHELQTPIAIFKAQLDNLIQDENITEQIASKLGDINETISRLDRINKNILLLSKIEKSTNFLKEEINIKSIIENQISFIFSLSNPNNISLKVDLDTNLTLHAELAQIEILLNNLLTNAKRHNINNGKIIILLKNNSLIIANTSNSRKLDENNIFKRFSKNKSNNGGTGLGLSIVKKIIDKNEWKLEYMHINKFHIFIINFKPLIANNELINSFVEGI